MAFPLEGDAAALYTDLYQLSMMQGYFESGTAEASATFDYFFRSNPQDGGYVIFAGLADLLPALESLRFGAEARDRLLSVGLSKPFVDSLATFRFEGTILSMQEGEVVFPHEPVVRVSGPILQVQLAETLLLNLLNFESLIATKASRIRLAARDRRIVDFGMRRAQGLGCLQASRAAIIGGVDATSNVLAACLDGLETSGTVAHSWVQSFDSELEAFRAQARSFGHATVLLVDTYDTLRSGVPHAIQVAQEMSERGERLLAIRLDSGDLAYLSRAARGMLDAAGLPHVKIAASNQLDETVIKSLLDQEAPIDIFGVGTKLVTSFDCPALDGVYKLCSARGTPRMKLSDVYRKMNLPGDKRVYRLSDEDGTLRGDVVVLEGEKPPSRMVDPFETERSAEIGGLSAEPLFREVMARGRVVGKLPGAVDSARIARESLSLLPREHQRFENPHVYRVGISPELFQLRRRLVEESRRREQGPSPGPT